jgi:hypothetical protein
MLQTACHDMTAATSETSQLLAVPHFSNVMIMITYYVS